MHAKALSADIANYDLVSAFRGLCSVQWTVSIADDNTDGKGDRFGNTNEMDYM